MKGRLSSTIWTIVGLNLLALAIVFVLGFSAGLNTGGFSLQNFPNLPSPAGMKLIAGVVLIVIAAIASLSMLGKRVVKPAEQLADAVEKLAGGDYRSQLSIESQDDFGYIAENLNRATEKIAKAAGNQEAQESLQRSVTDFLTIVSQIGRGDLTLRGKVTTDALGNVVDSVNYMLDNFCRVLERVRKSAIDVAGNANEILVASEDMSAGATQQDQEITNTSSAVEELTVSMKQVSNNAEASAEAARRALDAAEQGTGPCATRWKVCSASGLRCRPRRRRSSRWAT